MHWAKSKSNLENGEIDMKNNYNPINIKPSKDGNYLVKFYNKNMPEYDCIELVFRHFCNGKWDNPVYGYEGDGYELVGWYEGE